MKTLITIMLLTCVCTELQAQNNIITTIAGMGAQGYGGDDSACIYSKLSRPYSVCLDKWNNIYIADALNNRIRKINSITGIITTVAGDGTMGYSGDGLLATNAKISLPDAVFTDTLGNIYFADGGNNCIRKIMLSTGIITTVAGNGTPGNSGDNAPATDAELNEPSGLYLDPVGNMFIADYANNLIRRVDAISGIITTIAGNGSTLYPGDGGLATNAGINGAVGVFADNAGNVFIVDMGNNAVRKVATATGVITTVAGTGTIGYSGMGGPATAAQLNTPSGIFVDAESNIFIAEFGSGTVRRVDAVTGIITTVAGTGEEAFGGDGGPATDAQLRCTDVFFDSHGIMFIADYGNNRIRRVGPPDKTGVPTSPRPSPRERGTVCVWPNPVHDELVIDAPEKSAYRLLNNVGVCVRRGELRKGENTVSVKGMAAGVYMMEVGSPGLPIAIAYASR